MDLRQFANQLERCAMSDEEVRTFIRDFALVRLQYIIGELQGTAHLHSLSTPPEPSVSSEWTREALIASGVRSEWVSGRDVAQAAFLHIEAALAGDARILTRFLEMTLLSDKQKRVLFPCLSNMRTLKGPGARDRILEEVPRLNAMLHWAMQSGMDWDAFRTYQRHVKVHGASQNISGMVGAFGGIIAVKDALMEIAPGCIIDECGTLLPPNSRSPVQIYSVGGTRAGGAKALLLTNRRAVIFASDPDVAIIQSLESPFESAKQALGAWNDVRREVMTRSDKVHTFAVGEIKTATDVQNLHERLALGSRETVRETKSDRFLMMAVLTEEIISPDDAGPRRKKGTGFANQDLERFSDVFNLYFAWGYDDARQNHPDHWDYLKARLSNWCHL